MQSDDEIAFVLSHEASHHIAGHIGRQQQQQALGALVLGGLVAATGQAYGTPATDDAIRQAMDVGAYVGARAYSQSYELEADTLGAYVTARAGYDARARRRHLRPPGARQPRRPADPRHPPRLGAAPGHRRPRRRRRPRPAAAGRVPTPRHR